MDDRSNTDRPQRAGKAGWITAAPPQPWNLNMPITVRDLFGNEVSEYAMTPDQRKTLLGRKSTPKKGYAWSPGTGPEGETCGSCEHIERVSGARCTYPKCGLMRAKWTHGFGSDILVNSPACKKWVRATDWSRE
jgi:hypothetical protein